MSPDQEKQLRSLLGNHESDHIPKFLSWRVMEPRIFPRRRRLIVGWLLLFSGLGALLGIIWAVSGRADVGPTDSTSVALLEVTAGEVQEINIPTDEVEENPNTTVTLPTPPRRPVTVSVDRGLFVLPPPEVDRTTSPYAVELLPTLAILPLVVKSPVLPDLSVHLTKDVLPNSGKPRRFFSLAAGPGTFSLPLRPTASLPQDQRVDVAFTRAHSYRLRVDVAQWGRVNLTTGFNYQRVTNTLTPSALPVGQVATATISSLQLPLLVGYRYGTERWMLRATAGASVELRSWARGDVLPAGVPGSLAVGYADTPSYPLALVGELGVEYRLWSRLGLTFGMSYTSSATRLRYPGFERASRQVYRGSAVGVVFYPRR